MAGPSGDKLIHVDMTSQTAEVRDFPADWKLLGGRALSAKILLQECDPSCDPLGPDNVLVMAPGVVSGTAAPTSGRISIGGKSPLTGGIKEANAGGQPGQHLMKLGFRAVVVKGQPSDANARFALEVTADGVNVVPADDYKGKWNYALCEALHDKYPKPASFISIGPAGELKLAGSSVACTDQDNRYPARRLGVVGVTGTDGKTTTVHLIAHVLESAGRPAGFMSSVSFKSGEQAVLNDTHMTTVESPGIQQRLAEMADSGKRFAVLEASSHGLALHRLDECEFDVAVFTTLSRDHLDFHGTMQEYKAAKGRLFQMLDESVEKDASKAAIVNADDEAAGYFSGLSSAPFVSPGGAMAMPGRRA